MNVAIVGYGRMGKEIEKVLKTEGINIAAIIDKYADGANFKVLDSGSLKNIDVAIDFTIPEGIMTNFKTYIDNKVNVVVGTTGWFDSVPEVRKMVGDKIGFIWSGNFSIGVNIFFRMVRDASRIINKFEEYDSMCYELHHNKKKDSPSGTALMIANVMLGELKRKKRITTDKIDRAIETDELHVASVRGGSIPGTHSVLFDSDMDTIELKHTVRTRAGLAKGAVMATKWIKDKKGFFSIDDMMNSIF